MDVRKLKAKRIENGLLQKDLAKELGISTKTMCVKECDPTNRFTIAEIIVLSRVLHLSIEEVNIIFFDRKLPFV